MERIRGRNANKLYLHFDVHCPRRPGINPIKTILSKKVTLFALISLG